MTRKIDPDTPIDPEETAHETHREVSSRPPKEWPGIPARSQEDEASFVHDGVEESPAEVTEAQRKLERSIPRDEPEE
ncbi:MAG: hypothetical protein IRZ16_07960 [Myxococcaceae bacterium]|nr:hypothetical protein [Myxococcaceae bacterium]